MSIDDQQQTHRDERARQQSFEEAGGEARQGTMSEFLGFMRENAKWWLIPFLVVFLLLGAVLAFGSSAAAPFIYTLF